MHELGIVDGMGWGWGWGWDGMRIRVILDCDPSAAVQVL